MTTLSELDFANAVFICWLKTKFGWADVPANQIFSLYHEHHEAFKEFMKELK